MCYDLLNEYILDVVPEKYRASEIDMAKRHMNKDQEISKGYKSIYVMDRNYVSLEFMIHMKQNKIKFLKYEEIVEIYNKRWGIETMYYSLKSKLQI